MGEQPETSTVRSSLAIVAAAEQLLGRSDLDPKDAVALVDTVMVQARALRPHQVRDVADHLRARAESGAWQPVPVDDADPYGMVAVHEAGLDEQIDRLADFIIERVPGEPSQSEGAVDTAIRLLHRHYPPDLKRNDRPAHTPPFDDGRDERRARAVDNLTAEVLGGEDTP